MSSERTLDNRIVKRHYPLVNNNDEMSFVFQSDPNLCLLKNKIAIHFTVELPIEYAPDNGFVSKQFSQLQVELNSQKISNNKSRYVLKLTYKHLLIF